MPIALSDLIKTFFAFKGPFRSPQKNFSGSRHLPPLASKLPLVQDSFSFCNTSSDSPRVIRHPKNIFRSPPLPFQTAHFFTLPKAQSEAWKRLCSSQALSTLRKSCSRSRSILPGAGTRAAVAFYSEPEEPHKAPEEVYLICI